MLTYADNHAVGYFRKQGFKKNVTMKRERWQGFLKDYEGATLMECLVDPSIDYLSTRQVAEQQRLAVVKRLVELSSASKSEGGGESSDAAMAAAAAAKGRGDSAHRELLRTGWRTPRVEIRVNGSVVDVQQYLSELVQAVTSHADAWPFQNAVSIADAPDYYTVIKTPVDLSLVKARLQRTPKSDHNASIASTSCSPTATAPRPPLLPSW